MRGDNLSRPYTHVICDVVVIKTIFISEHQEKFHAISEIISEVFPPKKIRRVRSAFGNRNGMISFITKSSAFPCVRVWVSQKFRAKFKFRFHDQANMNESQNYTIIIENGNSRRVRVTPEDHVMTLLPIRSRLVVFFIIDFKYSAQIRHYTV